MGAAVYVRDTGCTWDTGCTRDARCTGDAVYVRAVPADAPSHPRETKAAASRPARAPRAASVPAALCARAAATIAAAAWDFFVRGAGQVPPPPRLPTGPGSERPPRSKSAAFAYSEQVGAHMPKMHQTKLATIIIIKCAVARGGGKGEPGRQA